MKWILLIISLPTENATVRMRIWRSLKASGAAVLRDGVYLLPERERCGEIFAAVASEARNADGKAWLLTVNEPYSGDFKSLFDRSGDYSVLLADMTRLRQSCDETAAREVIKQVRKLRKHYAQLTAIDFFPNAAQNQVGAALADLESTSARLLAPDEPKPSFAAIPLREIQDYQGRTWATRRRPWVDRLACAWLVHRFIDPNAQLLWLESPTDCPDFALSFDFDGATFSHVNDLTSFETMVASFQLQHGGLTRFAGVVHFLDVGGIPPPEASGIESVLTGLCAVYSDDDLLLHAASAVFDALLAAFANEANTP